MHREKYYRSKLPLSLALLFLLNVFLFVAMELLVVYKHPAIPNPVSLAKHNSLYENCTIASQDHVSSLNAALVQTSEGDFHLVVTKAHPIFFTRAKYLHEEPVSVQQDQQIYVKNGIHTSEIAIHEGPWVTIQYGYDGGIQATATFYLALGAVLEGLELLLWHLIRHGK